MSLLKPEAPIVPPEEDHQEMVVSLSDEAISPSSTKSINDLPPEVLAIILEFAMSGVDHKAMLGYRSVNPQWKDLMDSIIEKKIVSGEFPTFEIFPAMYLKNAVDQLELPVSAPAGENPFPFNSLRLMGTTICAPLLDIQERRHLTRMILPAFASNYFGTLTTFCLEGEEISIKVLSVMLRSMSNLKRLSLQVKEDDTISELGAVLPTPPPLPCLTTLDFKSLYWKRDPNEIEMMYLWLIASYADQLVRLDLNTSLLSFPPLQTSHEYTHSFPGGQTCSIATTSEVAFRKLKELVIQHRSREFLILSETPALRRLTVYSEDSAFDEHVTEVPFQLEDLITIIGKCNNTLETFILNKPWEVINTELTQLELPMATGAVVPRLKSLTIHYPFNSTSEVGLHNFLVKLPGLKTLKFNAFRPHKFDRHIFIRNQNQNGDIEAKEVGNDSNQNADEIVALKERLTSLFEQMTTDDRKKKQAYAAIDRLVQEFEEGYEVDAQMEQLEIEINDLLSTMSAARCERAAVFQRLADLGQKNEKVMVQQLLERREFRSTCPSLQTLSVSSEEKPDGNIFLVSRGDSA